MHRHLTSIAVRTAWSHARPRHALGVLCGLLATATTVRAQWSVVYLNTGPLGSSATGVRGGQQVGQAENHAVLWNGTAATAIDLHPSTAVGSWCSAIDGTQQVGATMQFGRQHASLWTGSAASWVDLNPVGAMDSSCFGVDAGQQVGTFSVTNSFVPHACLWTGSAASCVDLHPAGALQSQALAVAAGQQVGNVYMPTTGFRASLWNGSAASWTDLTPFFATNAFAYGTDGTQQVGQVLWNGVHGATVWNGSSASWTNLNPLGSGESAAYGVHGGQQVGYARLAGHEGAGLWSGTAASWVDLHVFLPSDFIRSRALAIWHEGTTTYVAGYGYNNTLLRNEALLWVNSPPVNYGTGCPGTGGLVPAIGAVGLPTLGNAGFGVRVTQGLPNSLCLVLANFAPASIPVGTCTVLVEQPAVHFLGATDGGGSFTFPLPLSTAVDQVGLDIFWQGLVLDPAGALLGFASLSGGSRTRIGF